MERSSHSSQNRVSEILLTKPLSSRLAKAFNELNDFVKNETDLKETKDYIAAEALLVEAKAQLA